jgi:hypothetical protein
MRGLSWHSAIPAALYSVAAVVLLMAAIGVGPTVASASAAPKVCGEAGITRSVVRKAFGPTARIGGEGVSEVGRCPIESSVNGKPPTECNAEQSSTCVNTEVELSPGGDFKYDVEAELAALDEGGHAKKSPFSGAGAGAVLLTASGYGGLADPVVEFEAGRRLVVIAPPRTPESETGKVYRQWEALARAIYAHLS